MEKELFENYTNELRDIIIIIKLKHSRGENGAFIPLNPTQTLIHI